MHELDLMQSLVATVDQRVGPARVLVVRLQVGRLMAVVPDALRFCFDVCAEGTCVEGARLEILEVAARARCRRCDAEVDVDVAHGPCACGSVDLEVVSGQELRVLNVEVT